MTIEVVSWHGDHVTILDQTALPDNETYLEIDNYRELIRAIRQLKVRGAPAIGIAAGYAVALGAMEVEAADRSTFVAILEKIIKEIELSRPTAVNLHHATARMRDVAARAQNISRIHSALADEARRIQEDETTAMRALAENGASLLPDEGCILTVCNTGVLATAAGYGTALGAIVRAVETGKKLSVIACETRPLLQGARLTAWELEREGIPAELIVDGAAASLMAAGKVDAVITGADRIARNGDAANKVGTYGLAVLAWAHKIPFYIAAPTSTIDLRVPSGREIPIEQRDPTEVTEFRGVPCAPPGFPALNPAFDVTPALYITAIVTEKGVTRPPYDEGLGG
jgi:methylthioribose-1-phosphate isomerase